MGYVGPPPSPNPRCLTSPPPPPRGSGERLVRAESADTSSARKQREAECDPLPWLAVGWFLGELLDG